MNSVSQNHDNILQSETVKIFKRCNSSLWHGVYKNIYIDAQLGNYWWQNYNQFKWKTMTEIIWVQYRSPEPMHIQVPLRVQLT